MTFIKFTNRDSGKAEWVAVKRIVRITECMTEGHDGFALLDIDMGHGVEIVEADETPDALMERLTQALG